MNVIQNVTIQLKSRIRDAESGVIENNTVTASGHLAIKNDTLYLKYTEEMAEIGAVHHTIKITAEEFTVMRQGALSMRMPLVVNRNMEGSYQTPAGKLNLETRAKRLDYKWNDQEENGTIHLVYDLTMQGQLVGRCDLRYQLTGGPL